MIPDVAPSIDPRSPSPRAGESCARLTPHVGQTPPAAFDPAGNPEHAATEHSEPKASVTSSPRQRPETTYNSWSIPLWYRPSGEDEVIRYFRKYGPVLGVNRSEIAVYNAASTVRQAFLRLDRSGRLYCLEGREKWPNGPWEEDLWMLATHARYLVQIGTTPGVIEALSWLEVVAAINPTLTALPPEWAAAFAGLYPLPGQRIDAGAEALRRELQTGKSRCDRHGTWAITIAPQPGADTMTFTVTCAPAAW